MKPSIHKHLDFLGNSTELPRKLLITIDDEGKDGEMNLFVAATPESAAHAVMQLCNGCIEQWGDKFSNHLSFLMMKEVVTDIVHQGKATNEAKQGLDRILAAARSNPAV